MHRGTRRPWLSIVGDALGVRNRVLFEMILEAEIESTLTCTWKPQWKQFGDAFEGWDRVDWEMLLEATIEWVRILTRKVRWSELSDSVGSCNHESLMMNLVTMIMQPWRLWSSGIEVSHGSHDSMNVKSMMQWVGRCTWRSWSSEIGGWLGGHWWEVYWALRLYS